MLRLPLARAHAAAAADKNPAADSDSCRLRQSRMETSTGDLETPPMETAAHSTGSAGVDSRQANGSGANVCVFNTIATRRKKTRAVCGICLQEDSIHDGWMHRCISCDVCAHAHCAYSLGLVCDGNQFKCGSCGFSNGAIGSSCAICKRKSQLKSVCVCIPVLCGSSVVSLVHAPCLILSRIHRLAPPPALPMPCPGLLMLHADDPATSRCCICRTQGGEMQQCMHATCGKLLHASCAADLKLVWFATARDYCSGNGASKMFTACSIQHVKQDQVFCTCLRPYDTQGSTMVQCDDCRAWFHCDCLGIDDQADDLEEMQSKQFRCAECSAKLSQSLPLHHPVFMCDVRRQWSHAKVLLPPKATAPSLDPVLPLSGQLHAVSAVAADLLVLILQTSKAVEFPDLRSPTCMACLSALHPNDISHNSLYSIISRRLCIPCRCARQALLHLCVPAPSCTITAELSMHSKARLVLEHAVDALAATPANVYKSSAHIWQKHLQMLERLVDAWDFSFRFSSEEVQNFHEDATAALGSCPCLTLIAHHAEQSCAIGLQLKACLEQTQLDLSSVFNLMQECRKFCCQSPHELHAASVTQEIAEISAKIDFYLECVSKVSVSGHLPQHHLLSIDQRLSLEMPSLEDVAQVLAAATSLHFESKSASILLQKVDEMRLWCARAEHAILINDESLLCAAADDALRGPFFSHPLIAVIEGKTWNVTAAKIVSSEKQFSLDFAVETLHRGQQLEEASLSVHKSLQQCVNVASEWEILAQKLCSKKMTKQEAEKHLQAYDAHVKLDCKSAQKLRNHIELAQSWFAEWGLHAEKGFEHMCSLPNLRQIIFRYSQFNIQLPCDAVMDNLLQFEPGQVKTITDHAVRVLSKKIAAFMLKMNSGGSRSGGASHFIHPEHSVFSCPFECCPWRQVSFTSHTDMLLHASRHIEASEFPEFKELFIRQHCSLQEAVDLVEQAAAFDDDSVTSSAQLRDRIAATRAWLDDVQVKALPQASSEDNIAESELQKLIMEGFACGLHTPQLECLQRNLITLKIEQAAASSVAPSLHSIEILLNISRNLGVTFPFGKIRFQTTVCDIFASTVLQNAFDSHRDSVAKLSHAFNRHDLAEFSVGFKMFAASQPLSPVLPLLAFVSRMTDLWKEKAVEFLKKNPHDSTSPYLAKTILGWMNWIRWFSECDHIAKLAKQLQKLAIDYKQSVGPSMACYAAKFDPTASVCYTMLLWPVDDASDVHLSNVTGVGETISLPPRCVVMAPLPPRWYTDAAPEAHKHTILNHIKKLGGQLLATKILCKRKDCGAKALSPDNFCSDHCAVQFEMDLLETIENSRIKRRAASREALSRVLSLSYNGTSAASEKINRLSASIESSFLRAIAVHAEVLPESYYTMLKNRITALRSFSPGCVRGMVVRGIADETILNHLSSTDVSVNTASSSASAMTPSSSSLPSLPVLPVLPALPELPAVSPGLKRGGSRKDEEAKKETRPSKVAKQHLTSHSVSVSGSSANDLCYLKCIHNEHHHDVDMASIPSAIVVQGRLAPSAVASFVNQVSNASGSSKFVALFQISSVSNTGCPPGLLDHVRSLLSMERVAVAPLGDDCQMYIGLGRQFAQVQIAVHLGDGDSLYAVAVLRKGKHALRR